MPDAAKAGRGTTPSSNFKKQGDEGYHTSTEPHSIGAGEQTGL